MKKIVMILLAVCFLTLQVSAHAVPDLNRQGSISVTMCYDGNTVAGGSMTLYRVGDIREENGNYSFILAPDFEASLVSLDAPQSAQTAKQLADYARKEKITGTGKTIDSAGKVTYENLQPGLYLLYQQEAAQGYQKANPFLVSLPTLVEESYSYDVDASPKVSPVPDESNRESPKTGQPLWPYWAFTLSALLLVLLTRRKKT